MLERDLQPYQTWRMAQLERARRALSMHPTTLPVVYVLRWGDGVACASVPAGLDAQHASLFAQWWGEDILAKCQVAQWHSGPLGYYASSMAPALLERSERAARAHQDVDDVLATLHRTLAELPLLVLVDVVVHWQQSWLRQDPQMQGWGRGPWRATGVPGSLWRYVHQRIVAHSPEFDGAW